MTTLETAASIAEPIGRAGSWFYFTPSTAEHGQRVGLDVVGFYALGRGGVLGNPTPGEVNDVFYFFKPAFVEAMYGEALAKQSPQVAVPAHLEAADDFARQTFGGIPTETLSEFTKAAAMLVASLPTGEWPLVDGYRSHPLPDDAAAAAYRYVILLREVRGGVHTDAVKASGLTGLQSCYLDHNGRAFAMHGFADEDIPVVTEAMRQRRLDAENDTSVRMAALLGVLTDEQQAALIEGAVAMRAALKNPVAVAD
ncbi:MAG: hypothetical protein WCP26_00490 [Actinomycetes bacterium]